MDFQQIFLLIIGRRFFSGSNPVSVARQHEIRGTIAYIANELLENTMKFRDDGYDVCPVSFRMSLSTQALRFYVTNGLSHAASLRFQDYIRTVLANDPAELYLQQLEANACSRDNSISRLGLLTLLNDYHVELAWKFEEFDAISPLMTVTVMAVIRLPFEEERNTAHHKE